MGKLYAGHGYGRVAIGEVDGEGHVFALMGGAKKLVGYVDINGMVSAGSELNKMKPVGKVEQDGTLITRDEFTIYIHGEVGDNGCVYAGNGLTSQLIGEVSDQPGGNSWWNNSPSRYEQYRGAAALYFLFYV